MHVLQLGPYPPPEGGINRNILAIRDALDKRGDRCSIIATSRSTRITPEADVYHPQSALALIRLLLSSDCDIVHLHVGGEITTRVLALVFVCSLFRRGRNILSFHSGGYPQAPDGRAAKAGSFRGWLFRRFARVIAVNLVIAGVFERYGVPPERLHVIQPFVPKAPDKTVEVPKSLREFAATSKPFLLTVCLLEDEYDLFMQIDAMENVLEKFPDARLMIVGSGSRKEQLKNAIAAKPYRDRIMLTDDVEHPVTLHLINDADILLRTTLFDGDAIAVREALFLDTSVIATDNAMRPDGVHLIAMHDANALVEKITELSCKKRPAKKPMPTDTSNIDAILDVYKGLMTA